MRRIVVIERAQPDEVFAPNAFDRNVGKVVRLTAEGIEPVTGTLVAAQVADDGHSVTLTFDFPGEALASSGSSTFRVGAP